MLPEHIESMLTAKEQDFLSAAMRASLYTTDGSVSANKISHELGWSIDKVKLGSILVNLLIKNVIYDVADLGGDYVLKIGVSRLDYADWPPQYDR
ncbi:MAG: hypothetical protein ABI670_20345 [Chloroflexota bacterium]